MRLDRRRRPSPTDALLRAAREGAEAVTQIQIELCEIAAPIGEEAARGDAVARWLRSSGCDVRRDGAGNVIGRRAGRGDGPAVALSAHLDSVFPPGQPVRVARGGEPDPYRDGESLVPAGRLHAPGIADDTAGLAAMIGVSRAFAQADPITEHDVLFVATVGEEGRGDLKGARHFFRGREGRALRAFVTLDHPQPDVIVHRGIASRRYLIEFSGPGGHSWGHAGRYNPALTLADAAGRIGAIATPDRPRTVCNIGVMSAGESVNAIPERASMQVDLRSEDPGALDALDAAVQRAIADAQAAAGADRAELVERGELYRALWIQGGAVVGIVAALLYLRTRTLIVPIVFHAANNLLATLAGYFLETEGALDVAAEIQEIRDWGVAGIGLFAVTLPVLIWYIRRNWPGREEELPYGSGG
jgi:acetylornithine deacetylase/succinyl-diaminopimelate desuccinylase-like protein